MSAAAADPRVGNVDWSDNWTFGHGLRVEIMETATADVWLCHTPVDRDTVRTLDLPEGFRLAGVGGAVADAAYFDRSPDAEADGPLEVMDVDGFRFCRVARPVGHEQIGSVTILSVRKHHSMVYDAGRTIEVIDLGDGTVLTPAWSDSGDEEPEVLEGWFIERVELVDDLISRIPDPATVAVLSNGDGFHGPIPRSAIDEVTK